MCKFVNISFVYVKVIFISICYKRSLENQLRKSTEWVNLYKIRLNNNNNKRTGFEAFPKSSQNLFCRELPTL